MIKNEIIDWLINEESGQGMVEYSLILILIVIGVIGLIALIGEKTYNMFESSANEIP